jgi:predicted metalloendopeptidase
MPMARKTGKPRALEENNDNTQQTPEEFVQEFFPPIITATGEEIATGNSQAQSNLPTLDWLKAHFKTKSAAIRYLYNLGPKVGYPNGTPPKIIAQHLGIRPQHARNVCKTPLKRGPNEDWRILPNGDGDGDGGPPDATS